MSGIFRQHGKFSIHVDGSLLVTNVTGPWNKELVEHWSMEALPVAQELSKTGPYVGIAVISDSMLCPADAVEALARSARYSAEKLNCLAYVFVAESGVEGRNLIEPAYARSYEGILTCKFFYGLDEAKDWALGLLASHSVNEQRVG